jgi:hypothetical protein
LCSHNGAIAEKPFGSLKKHETLENAERILSGEIYNDAKLHQVNPVIINNFHIQADNEIMRLIEIENAD